MLAVLHSHSWKWSGNQYLCIKTSGCFKALQHVMVAWICCTVQVNVFAENRVTDNQKLTCTSPNLNNTYTQTDIYTLSYCPNQKTSPFPLCRIVALNSGRVGMRLLLTHICELCGETQSQLKTNNKSLLMFR